VTVIHVKPVQLRKNNSLLKNRKRGLGPFFFCINNVVYKNMDPKKSLKVVTLGGGTGSFTLLSGIKNIPNISIVAIVPTTDDGGSTGVLRDELGVLPPGDARQCLIALSEESDMVRKLMSYRFEDGGLTGHSFGNIFLAGLEKVTGSFSDGIEVASKILKTKGEVIPITDSIATLHAVLSNGNTLSGEDTINQTHFKEHTVKSLYIDEENTQINPRAKKEIEQADVIIICPGNHYSSVLPNLIIPGTKEAFLSSKASIIYVPNLTNKKGHTLGWTIRDYLEDIEKAIGKKVSTILINTDTPTQEQINSYKLQEGDGVLVINDLLEDERSLHRPLMSHAVIYHNPNDIISHTRSFIRHDQKKLQKVFEGLLFSDNT
jgi:uncharacterized cofD-like protein